MTYYSVLEVTPTREDWIPEYIGPANKLVAQHGGKNLARNTLPAHQVMNASKARVPARRCGS